MPSAARQRLPSELWRSGKNRSSCSSPGGSSSPSEMQVSPGHYDGLPEEKQQRQRNRKNSLKSQKCHKQGRSSPKTFTRKGSRAGAVSDTETDSLHAACSDGSVGGMVPLSSSPQSDSGLNYSTPSSSDDVYAMESTPAPDPSELPFPPLEWLQPSTGKTSPVSSDFGSFNLQTILGCTVVA